MDFKIKLKQFRKELGLTQQEFAMKCGFSRTTITELESGKKAPTLKMIERLALATNTELVEWINTEDENVQAKPFDGLTLIIKKLRESNLIDKEGNMTEQAKRLLHEMLELEVKLFIKELEKNK